MLTRAATQSVLLVAGLRERLRVGSRKSVSAESQRLAEGGRTPAFFVDGRFFCWGARFLEMGALGLMDHDLAESTI